MLPPSVRRLSLSDLNADSLRALIEHGEDVLVERKRKPPESPKFGAAVASFANTLGGWILLGVDDDRSVFGFELDEKTDVQSHLADLLRRQVDPLPPFVAERYELDGKCVVAMRIFESADGPHIVRGTGAVYVRTSNGKQPVDDHATLIGLARAGREAEAEANARLLRGAPLGHEELWSLTAEQTFVRTQIRVAPLTVTPQFTDWPMSAEAARWLQSITGDPSTVEPAARGVAVRSGLLALGAIDSNGVIELTRQAQPTSSMDLNEVRRRFVRPALDFGVMACVAAEAIGRARYTFSISLNNFSIDLPDSDDGHRLSVGRVVSGDLTIPADDGEINAEGLRVQREITRSLGVPAWENAS
jgi:hypothetical protein